LVLPGVEKRLSRLPRPDCERIVQALLSLRESPFDKDVKPLRGRPYWRLRVGGWHVLLRVDREARAIHAVSLGPRGDVYK
jgi:mRNA interferase RelE/StbE